MGSPSSRRAPVPLSSSCTVPFAIAASLLLVSSLVGAVDILFCPQNFCHGVCTGCDDIPDRDCCLPSNAALSVLVQNAEIDVPAIIKFYNRDGCTDPPEGLTPPRGDQCKPRYFQRAFTGAYWLKPPNPPPLNISDIADTRPAVGYMYSNAAFFTEPGMEGKWVLRVTNFTEYFSQVNNLSYAETLDWAKSQGAYYKP